MSDSAGMMALAASSAMFAACAYLCVHICEGYVAEATRLFQRTDIKLEELRALVQKP